MVDKEVYVDKEDKAGNIETPQEDKVYPPPKEVSPPGEERGRGDGQENSHDREGGTGNNEQLLDARELMEGEFIVR